MSPVPGPVSQLSSPHDTSYKTGPRWFCGQAPPSHPSDLLYSLISSRLFCSVGGGCKFPLRGRMGRRAHCTCSLPKTEHLQAAPRAWLQGASDAYVYARARSIIAEQSLLSLCLHSGLSGEPILPGEMALSKAGDAHLSALALPHPMSPEAPLLSVILLPRA